MNPGEGNGAAVVRLSLAVSRQPERCEIVAGLGALDRLAALLHEQVGAGRYVVVADSNVAPLHGVAVLDRLQAADLTCDLVTVPAGEANKTATRWLELLERFAALPLGRDGCVVAVGGGVTGDLAGFAAATFARGVALVHVPTTLLAMVDAAVGGKAAVDLPAGKNLVGAFHQPRLVVADPATLATLPDDELLDGFAEALKHGLGADADYLDRIVTTAPALLARDTAALHGLIVGSLRIKSAVVARDPFETGERAILNFGHTVAHGLERASGFALRHGRAVAAGMVAEAAAAEAAGISEAGTAQAVRRAVAAFRLPTAPPGDLDPHDVLHAARVDKKNRGGEIRYSLIRRPGVPAVSPDGDWTWPLRDDLVRAALTAPGPETV
jgi:3-dehydroquinate synthase